MNGAQRRPGENEGDDGDGRFQAQKARQGLAEAELRRQKTALRTSERHHRQEEDDREPDRKRSPKCLENGTKERHLHQLRPIIPITPRRPQEISCHGERTAGHCCWILPMTCPPSLRRKSRLPICVAIRRAAPAPSNLPSATCIDMH